MTAGLDILGVGLDIPPAVDTRELCQSAGADTTGFRGWDRVCVAHEDEHPSTMGAAALRAAVDDAGISPADLGIVVSAGMSRDYLPSWSLSTEIMKAARTRPSALGIDLTLGCLGTLAALNVAHGWLTVAGGGYAAIVTAERWAYTVDRAVTSTMTLWAHSDGAGALVVGLGTGDPVLAVYRGAEFVSVPELNGRVLIKYGGTRYPAAPWGVSPAGRTLSASPRDQVRDTYRDSYDAALNRADQAVRRRPVSSHLQPDHPGHRAHADPADRPSPVLGGGFRPRRRAYWSRRHHRGLRPAGPRGPARRPGRGGVKHALLVRIRADHAASHAVSG